MSRPKTVFEPCPDPKNGPLGPQKYKNDPKFRIEGTIEKCYWLYE